ncbi:hypothetical protein HYU21_04330 [Candidatus Woesearchaeota archaeon]|nr:hypothetical protein [Candidatus Woesearchaeota archaeon]
MTIGAFEEKFLRKRIHPLNFLVWGLFITILVGGFLLWLPFTHKAGVEVSAVNALFTATSASTVTGLVVIDTFESYNFWGQLIILLLINLGGLGYMTLITFSFLNSKIGLKYAVYMKESLNLPSIGDIFQLAKKVFLTIILFEFVGILMLMWVFRDQSFLTALWNGIFHAMSAFNNAGFDLMGGFRSFMDYSTNIILNLVIMMLIFCGGIGFIVISDVWGVVIRLKKKFSLHTKIVLTTSLFLIIFGALSFYYLESQGVLSVYDSTLDKGIVSTFQSVTSRTAGFATIDFGKVSTATVLLITLLMFVGASPGSTGSGIKTTTFAVIVLFIFAALKNKDMPEAFGRRIARESLEKALLLFILSLVVIFFFIVFISIVEPFSLSQIVFEAFSAFGTVGLSTGITPHLTSASKLALILLMFIGRLTPLTLVVWISRNQKKNVELLEEYVSIG